MRTIGFVLFALSFLVPPRWARGADFHMFGGFALFIATPVNAFEWATAKPGDAPEHGLLLALVAIAAWATNFTVFLRLSRLLACATVALPWVAYVFFFGLLVSLIPFYFWALGLAFIHGPRLLPSNWTSAPSGI